MWQFAWNFKRYFLRKKKTKKKKKKKKNTKNQQQTIFQKSSIELFTQYAKLYIKWTHYYHVIKGLFSYWPCFRSEGSHFGLRIAVLARDEA